MAKLKAFEFVPPQNWLFLHNAEIQATRTKAEEYAARNFHFEHLEQHVEEYLRQWILRELIESYGYAENSLWIANTSKRNANVVVKDDENKSVALVAARYFGDADVDFAKACQDLQSDLEEIETVRFGLVTDGKRLACLFKSAADDIADYKTIEDFPTADELLIYTKTGIFPALKIETQRFQKLPASIIVQPTIKADNNAPRKFNFPFKNLFKRRNRIKNPTHGNFKISKIGAGIGAAILIFGGVWFFGKASAVQNAGSQIESTTVSPDKNVKEKLIITAPERTSSGEKPARSEPRKSGGNAPQYSNPDAPVHLSADDRAIMQSRPPMSNPSAKTAPPKQIAAPKPEQQANEQKKRTIIEQPYSRPN